jgi:hypothetical protein
MEKTECKSGEVSPLQKLSNYYKNPINVQRDERISGTYAWMGLLASVIIYDYYAIKTKKAETLTRAFWRLTEEKGKSVAPIAIWSTITLHLLLEKNIRKKKFGEVKNQ